MVDGYDQAKAIEIQKYIDSPEFSIQGDFYGKHILSIEQFETQDLAIVVQRTNEIKNQFSSYPPNLLNRCEGRILVPLFFEASTRTDTSFQAAMKRLGGDVIIPSNGIQFSSVYKGENLPDTLRALGCYGDVIVFRHPQKRSSFEAAWALQLLKERNMMSPSLISGGDGVGEHPTQALLDIYTILEKKGGTLDGLTITLVGDLCNGRTVHSLSKAIAKVGGENTNLVLVSPESLRMPQDVLDYVDEHGIKIFETSDIHEVLPASDVVYWTRVQGERFPNQDDYEAIKNDFIMTPSLANSMKNDAVFMHPLPRNHEMGTEEDHLVLDRDPRFIINEQMQNGMFVRMAILDLVLNKQYGTTR